MKAVVTGGCGFIGYNLTSKLKENGWNVVVVDNLSSGYRSNFVEGVQYYYNSVQNAIDHVIQSEKPDVIFHLAAVPRVSYSVEHPLETTEENVLMTVKLLDSVRNLSPNTRIVYSSSSSVYGGAENLPTKECEDIDPKSPYALQKWQGEEWGKVYANLYDMDFVALRYFNVFGPYSRYGGAYSTVLSAWLYSIYVDSTVQPFLEGDGKQTRDFCYVDNVVQANMKAAQNATRFKGDAFNVAQGQRHSLLDCKEIIEKHSGKKLELEVKPRRVGDVDHTLADIRAAKVTLGYKPASDFEDQVKRMAEWYATDYSTD